MARKLLAENQPTNQNTVEFFTRKMSLEKGHKNRAPTVITQLLHFEF